MKIVWRKKALDELKQIFNYIREGSLGSAIKVREAIFNMTDDLSQNPEKFPLDKYKI